MDSFVTIGICVKNGSDTILGALESVMAQSFPHEQMEVIVVDDGSEDGTLSVVHGYASKIDMPVKILHYAWQGIGQSRNTVAKNALGKYIVWVDSDMVLSKNFVKEQVKFMETTQK